jgi:hypothetical protein
VEVEVSVKYIEKIGFPGFGFFLAWRQPRFAGVRRAPGGKTQLAGSKDGDPVYNYSGMW